LYAAFLAHAPPIVAPSAVRACVVLDPDRTCSLSLSLSLGNNCATPGLHAGRAPVGARGWTGTCSGAFLGPDWRRRPVHDAGVLRFQDSDRLCAWVRGRRRIAGGAGGAGLDRFALRAEDSRAPYPSQSGREAMVPVRILRLHESEARWKAIAVPCPSMPRVSRVARVGGGGSGVQDRSMVPRRASPVDPARYGRVHRECMEGLRPCDWEPGATQAPCADGEAPLSSEPPPVLVVPSRNLCCRHSVLGRRTHMPWVWAAGAGNMARLETSGSLP